MSTQTYTKEDIEAIECRHVYFCPAPNPEAPDLHLVKEVLHLKDGRKVPNLRKLSNYKRPFWITREGFRNHEQKKEWEFLDRVQKFECRETDLERSIQNALQDYRDFRTRRQLFRNPYIYGAEISSRALIKKRWMDNFKASPTPSSLCVLDIETDVVKGTDEILMITVTMKHRVYTAVVASFVEGIADVPALCKARAQKEIGEILSKRNIQWEIDIVKDPVTAILNTFKRVHEWKPDYVAVWNLNFDLLRLVQTLECKGLDPALVFSEPSLPKAYKYFRYNKGKIKRTSSSGVVTNLKPSQQWDTATCPASFQFIDAMQAYVQLRTGQGELRSYSLNAIAEKHLSIRKLHFKEDAHILDGTLEWHRFMQSNCQVNYIIYNIFDCILMELLDEETNDLAFMISVFSGASELEIFDSQPRRKCNELHFELLQEYNRVLGTASDKMRIELDDEVYSLSGWIVALPAQLVAKNGLCILKEAPNLQTSVRIAVADLDVRSSYPNNGVCLNVSKETTVAEAIEIDGVSMFDGRMQGLGLCGGQTNSLELATTIFKLPSLEDWVRIYDEQAITA